MNNECCNTCRYSRPARGQPVLECHQDTPKTITMQVPVQQALGIAVARAPNEPDQMAISKSSYWPPVDPTEWCGKYEPILQ